MSSDPEAMGDLRRPTRGKAGGHDKGHDKEYNRVKGAYDETATLEGAPNLAAYEARARRFDRINANRPLKDRGDLAATATQIRADVDATEQRALANLVRDRATRTMTDRWAIVLYATFALGFLAFGISANFLDSERATRIATAKSCADAKKALSAGKADSRLLPPICTAQTKADTATTGSTSATKRPKKATPAQVELAALKTLMASYSRCVDAATSGTDPACTRLRLDLSRAAKP